MYFIGSEDNYIYMWRTSDLPPSISVRKDRNPMWERMRAHNSVVTAAVFAPKPNLFLSALEESWRDSLATTDLRTKAKSLTSSILFSGVGSGLESNRNGRNR